MCDSVAHIAIVFAMQKQLYRTPKAYIESTFALQKSIYRVCASAQTKKEKKQMADGKDNLRELSIQFAILVSDICDNIDGCGVFKSQLIRSSSSIGANLHEAKYAQSRADFINKLEIALKESSETEYWLEILHRKSKISEYDFAQLRNMCGSIKRKLIASVTTAKNNGQQAK